MMKKIKILFGEMGGGKNFWGENFSRSTGLPFFDGDTVVTSEMVERVSKFKPLTRDMIHNYIRVLVNEIADRAEASSEGLIVAQALYNDSDRIFIREFLKALGFEVELYWVKASIWNNLKQIYSRKNGLRWVLYWLMNKPFFQKPTHTHYIQTR